MTSRPPWQTEDEDIGPELYETPDLIEDTSTVRTSVYTPETNDVEDIDHAGIHASEAAHVFRNESIATKGADFSDAIGGHAGSRGLLRHGRSEIGESLEERIRRLRDEIDEVRREVAAQGSDEDQIDDLENALAALRVRQNNAAAAIVKQIGTKPAPTPSSTLALNLAPQHAESWELEKLEERITGMEDTLGLSVSAERSLLPAIDALEEKVDLLSRSPKELEEQIKRIKRIHVEGAKNKDEGDAPFGTTDTLIDSIYEILPSLEKMAPVVPAMLERLQSLRHIHEYAADSFDILKTVQHGQEKTDRNIHEWTESLVKLETKLDESEMRIQANVEHTQTLLQLHEKRQGLQ